MLTLRKSSDRGHADHGWLNSYHSFSFADYHDPRFMGYRSLRVINEDWVSPGNGFGMHPHKDMEILTYVVQGQLKHKDSMGHEAVIKEGDVQKITAGTGIMHSEFNPSSKEPVHLLQIWVLPGAKGIKPAYQQESLATWGKEGVHLFASPDGGPGRIKFEQDAYIYHGYLPAGHIHQINMAPGRGGWLQMIKGRMKINGIDVNAGDAVSMEEETLVDCLPVSGAEFLFFDLK